MDSKKIFIMGALVPSVVVGFDLVENVAFAEEYNYVNFVDKNLEKIVKEKIGVSTADKITTQDLQRLEKLDLYEESTYIKSLVGLEKATSLKEFTFSATTLPRNSNTREMSQVDVYNVLKQMQSVESLTIHDTDNYANEVQTNLDLDFLYDLPNLKSLSLKDSVVKDLKPIGSLANLEELNLGMFKVLNENLDYLDNKDNLKTLRYDDKHYVLPQNAVDKFSNLTNLEELLVNINNNGYYYTESEPFIDFELKPMPNLKKLSVVGTHDTLGDILVMPNLDEIDLTKLSFTVANGLEKLTAKKVSIYQLTIPNSELSRNFVDNVTTEEFNISYDSNMLASNYIKSFKNIKKLSVRDRQSSNVNTIFTNLNSLITLKELEYINSNFNGSSGMLSIPNLTKARFVVRNISTNPFFNMNNLDDLSLEVYNGISNTNSITGLTSLKRLEIKSSRLNNLSGFSNLTNLEYLNLENNNITSITELQNLPKLKSLSLYSNPNLSIENINTRIENLNVGASNLTDITELGNLTEANMLVLWGNKLTNVDSIKDLPNLKYVELSYNLLADLPKFVHSDSVNVFANLISSLDKVEDVSNLLNNEGLKDYALWGNIAETNHLYSTFFTTISVTDAEKLYLRGYKNREDSIKTYYDNEIANISVNIGLPTQIGATEFITDNEVYNYSFQTTRDLADKHLSNLYQSLNVTIENSEEILPRNNSNYLYSSQFRFKLPQNNENEVTKNSLNITIGNYTATKDVYVLGNEFVGTPDRISYAEHNNSIYISDEFLYDNHSIKIYENDVLISTKEILPSHWTMGRYDYDYEYQIPFIPTSEIDRTKNYRVELVDNSGNKKPYSFKVELSGNQATKEVTINTEWFEEEVRKASGLSPTDTIILNHVTSYFLYNPLDLSSSNLKLDEGFAEDLNNMYYHVDHSQELNSMFLSNMTITDSINYEFVDMLKFKFQMYMGTLTITNLDSDIQSEEFQRFINKFSTIQTFVVNNAYSSKEVLNLQKMFEKLTIKPSLVELMDIENLKKVETFDSATYLTENADGEIIQRNNYQTSKFKDYDLYEHLYNLYLYGGNSVFQYNPGFIVDDYVTVSKKNNANVIRVGKKVLDNGEVKLTMKFEGGNINPYLNILLGANFQENMVEMQEFFELLDKGEVTEEEFLSMMDEVVRLQQNMYNNEVNEDGLVEYVIDEEVLEFLDTKFGEMLNIYIHKLSANVQDYDALSRLFNLYGYNSAFLRAKINLDYINGLDIEKDIPTIDFEYISEGDFEVSTNTKSPIKHSYIAEGNVDSSYFKDSNNEFKSLDLDLPTFVTKNGEYTIYIEDSLGRKNTHTFEVSDIVVPTPQTIESSIAPINIQFANYDYIYNLYIYNENLDTWVKQNTSEIFTSENGTIKAKYSKVFNGVEVFSDILVIEVSGIDSANKYRKANITKSVVRNEEYIKLYDKLNTFKVKEYSSSNYDKEVEENSKYIYFEDKNLQAYINKTYFSITGLDAYTTPIKKSSEIRELHLKDIPITSLKGIEGFPFLSFIHIENTKLETNDLDLLSEFEYLQSVSLVDNDNVDITDEDLISRLNAMAFLNEIKFVNNKTTSNNFRLNNSNLVAMTLVSDNITEIEYLNTMPKLQSVVVPMSYNGTFNADKFVHKSKLSIKELEGNKIEYKVKDLDDVWDYTEFNGSIVSTKLYYEIYNTNDTPDIDKLILANPNKKSVLKFDFNYNKTVFRNVSDASDDYGTFILDNEKINNDIKDIIGNRSISLSSNIELYFGDMESLGIYNPQNLGYSNYVVRNLFGHKPQESIYSIAQSVEHGLAYLQKIERYNLELKSKTDDVFVDNEFIIRDYYNVMFDENSIYRLSYNLFKPIVNLLSDTFLDIDKLKPEMQVYVKDKNKVFVEAFDDQSGIAKIFVARGTHNIDYFLNGRNDKYILEVEPFKQFYLNRDGMYTFVAIDNNGNYEIRYIELSDLDLIAPSMTYSTKDKTNSDVIVTINPDVELKDLYEYNPITEEWDIVTDREFTFVRNGVRVFKYMREDSNGVVFESEPKLMNVSNIDKENNDVVLYNDLEFTSTQYVNLISQIADLDNIFYILNDGQETQFTSAFKLDVGNNILRVFSKDLVGNLSRTIDYQLDIEATVGTVNVVYQDKNGTVLRSKLVEEVEFDVEHTELAIDIDGYYLVDEAEKSVTLNKNNPNQTITFIYDVEYTEGNVNVLYVDMNGNVLRSKLVEEVAFDVEHTESAIDIDGYVLNDDEEKSVTLTKDNPNQTITFKYDVEIEFGTVEVRYVDENNELLSNKLVRDVKLDELYSESAITIFGYTLKDVEEKSVTLTKNNLHEIITFVYEKDVVIDTPEYCTDDVGNLILDKDGKPIVKTKEEDCDVEDTPTTPEPPNPEPPIVVPPTEPPVVEPPVDNPPVVEPPKEPTPSNPTPSNPTPSNPTPSNPIPSNPIPSNPIPSVPNPTPIIDEPIDEVVPPKEDIPQSNTESESYAVGFGLLLLSIATFGLYRRKRKSVK